MLYEFTYCIGCPAVFPSCFLALIFFSPESQGERDLGLDQAATNTSHAGEDFAAMSPPATADLSIGGSTKSKRCQELTADSQYSWESITLYQLLTSFKMA